MVSSDEILESFMNSVNEVRRLKQLNMELLETLEETMLWFKDYHEATGIPIPHVEIFKSLVSKADRLIDEICVPSMQKSLKLPAPFFDDPKEVPEP